MEQGFTQLLIREKRRRRLMFGAVALGVSLIAISSRSERAMFQSGVPMPGVFATIGTDLADRPRVSLLDRDPSAFFARLDRDVQDSAPEQEEEGPLGPTERALLFVGPDAQLPAPGPIEIAMLDGPDDPQAIYNPQSSTPPETSDPFFVRRLVPEGASSSGGGSGGTGSTSSGGDGGSTSGGTSSGGDTSTGGGSSSSGGTTAVPEPGTWALMLVGFMSVGAALRAQSRRRATLPSAS
ncbi:PEPxxWA-CTERM sorting domain-containing protein [Sphingobium sp. DEHP117]|uniref:PEPxxWA-CTERM sorting domain-containing protein n=1 Tax=Sphingobium sp. DEHP117 TaxID=2993436 RepID=UPI0027D4E16B|nr:PEPxxWA-CTERM sorting domain-containing protein [Sphingobium sp. DEHP117]MDQ4420017.1 PEPxxWA-CTERM sorting domain-containing protein [Sphingobium sp. DEHP117]